MKSFVPFIFAIIFCITVSAQTNKNPYNVYQSSEVFNPTKAYVGFSTGINNMVGILGISLDAVINENVTIGGGIGLSTWGYKWELNLQYYPKGWRGFYMKGGYSQNTGLKDFEPEMELYGGSTEYVMMDLEPVGNLILAAGYAWKVGKYSKFYLEGGYAVPLTTEDYYNLHDETIRLSSTSEQVLQLMRPGGIILALGVNIAL
jgi:hypothetical protein